MWQNKENQKHETVRDFSFIVSSRLSFSEKEERKRPRALRRLANKRIHHSRPKNPHDVRDSI